jgi:hypothetical protein
MENSETPKLNLIKCPNHPSTFHRCVYMGPNDLSIYNFEIKNINIAWQGSKLVNKNHAYVYR